MTITMTHEQYKKVMLWKRVQESAQLWYQCVAQAKDYCRQVRNKFIPPFWGTAYTWRLRRAIVFEGHESVSGFATVPVGSIVIFKPYATVQVKKPWALFWKTVKLTAAGHVAVVDYTDNTGVIRVIEQNGGTWNWDGKGSNAIRLRWYKGKDAVAGFILQ